uniref:Uncharacterized protein n=1 Tax=Panagrolaimus davidi TaxID=227884 RepID=A0A914QAS9_9BILA
MQKFVKMFWPIILIELVIQETLVHAAPIPQYSQNGEYGRDLSNQFDQRYNGGMNRNPFYEGYVRPITHTLWHGGAAIAQSIDNGRKYMGSYFTGKNPNYHNPHNEFNRARINYNRIGEGRLGYQSGFNNGQRYMNNPYNNGMNPNYNNNFQQQRLRPNNYGMNQNYPNSQNGYGFYSGNNPAYRNFQYGQNPNGNQYGRVYNDRYPGYQRNQN